MNDMLSVIIPKSDQLNADDLIGGPRTITIAKVTIRPGTEQPVSIHFDGDNNKPYKPCKSMARVMVHCWGPDANQYGGRAMTIYCDPKVQWGGMAVGGIRISHMTDIPGTQVMALTATKGSRKPFTVNPLAKTQDTTTKARQTVGEWINATLAPSLVACGDAESLAKVRESKPYIAAVTKGTDQDRKEIQRLVDGVLARLSPPTDDVFPDDKP